MLLYVKLFMSGQNMLHAAIYFAYYSLLFGIIGVIALYDKRHTYIPIAFLFSFCILTLLMLGIRYIDEPTPETLLSPLVVALPFLLLFILSKGKGVGFGDVVLFFGIGAFFGIAQGIAVLMISIWLGAFVGSVMYIINRRKKDFTRELPFVPFIVIAFIIVLFTDIDILSIANALSRWYH
jgi:prepilin signal peptidase PulO-like enzyme (type II secretory pathway)